MTNRHPVEHSQDWYPSVGKKNLSRLTRIMSSTDLRQEKIIENLMKNKKLVLDEIVDDNLNTEVIETNMSDIYGLDENKKWKHLGKKCLDCGKVMHKIVIINKHHKICTKVLKLDKIEMEMNMPIQRVVKNGEVYYRWGTQGKLYKNIQDAEKQAKAIYASGYKSTDNKKS